jgi:deoxyribonuclease IV
MQRIKELAVRSEPDILWPSMRFGAHVSIAGGLERVWPRADGDRCEALQIFTQSGRSWASASRDPGEVREFADEARRRALPLLAHDSYLINLAAAEGVVASRSRDAFAQELDRCEALGVQHLVFHPGAHLGDGIEVGLPRVAAALREALDATPGYDVRALIEVTAGQGTCLGARFAEVRWILDEVGLDSRTGVCFDTCHAYAAGYDLRADYDAVWRELDRVIGLSRLHAFHVNDSRRELGSRVDRHAGIGSGTLGSAFFRRLARDPRFAGVPAVLELPPDLVTSGLARLRRWRGRS